MILARTFIDTFPPLFYAEEAGDGDDVSEEEVRAMDFVTKIEPVASAACAKAVFADWAFASNITDENQQASVSLCTRNSFSLFLSSLSPTALHTHFQLDLDELVGREKSH